MPDLGPYAVPVLTAYAGSISALLILVALSVRRSRKIKAALEKVENG